MEDYLNNLKRLLIKITMCDVRLPEIVFNCKTSQKRKEKKIPKPAFHYGFTCDNLRNNKIRKVLQNFKWVFL